MNNRHCSADGHKQISIILWTAASILVLALLILNGCSSTGSRQTAEKDLSFSSMYYEPTKGRVNQSMFSELKITESDLPYKGCDFSADTITVTGTVPPGITSVPGKRLRPDMLTTYFDGKPTQAGEFVVQVTFNKISCNWKYDTRNYGDRTVTVKFRIEK
jgi:hypothetical protein